MRLPKPESSATEHRFVVVGKSFDYTATAGTLIIRDDEDKPIASIGYVAYVRHDLKGGGARFAERLCCSVEYRTAGSNMNPSAGYGW